MIFELDKKDFYKVKSLIKNSNHELSINAVINGTSPGEIFVDNCEKPLSALIMTSECKVVAGNARNNLFNEGVRGKLDFYDQLTCDDHEWEDHISELHSNVAIRKYTRRYYELEKLKFTDYINCLDPKFTIEHVSVGNLNILNYENSDKIRDWIKLEDTSKFNDYCLGSYIRQDNKIVSMSLVDCIVDNRIEIGVKTEKEYRNNGLGAIACAATISASILNGIERIGWHCVDTNIGTIKIAEKLGFKLIKKYSSFTPYPPIENDTDLTKEQWSDWARYYTEMNDVQPYYYWLSAECWAKASNMEQTIENIKKLIEAGQMWFAKYLRDVETFKAFEGNKEWQKLLSLVYE